MTDPTPAPAPAPVPAGPLTEAEDKQWAGLSHLLGILGILPSLIIFLVFKDRGARTRVESKEGLNWQITVLAAYIVLAIVFGIISGILTGLAFASNSYGAATGLLSAASAVTLIPGVVWVVNIIFSIVGFTKVNAGGAYRYPFAIRLVK
jgi:uncharacterized Tic20 family protein